MKCICSWPMTCSGYGVIRCRDAHHDCYCRCGCEMECYGCANCDARADEYGEEDLADSDEEHVP